MITNNVEQRASVLLITHKNVGDVLLETVKITLGGMLPLTTSTMAVGYRDDPDQLKPHIQSRIAELNHGAGVLLLTDMFGSTPCNLARSLSSDNAITVVAGLNLPMLIRVMNYPDLTLKELTQKALSGGREGVVSCCNKREP